MLITSVCTDIVYLPSDWSDPNWTSLKSLRGGVSDNAREDRRIMFGDNLIEIEGRSMLQLLVDEVGPICRYELIQA